jgi:hypothetical protein
MKQFLLEFKLGYHLILIKVVLDGLGLLSNLIKILNEEAWLNPSLFLSS